MSYALCFNCASVYCLSNADEYTCPYCNHSIDAAFYKRIFDYAKIAVYYGYDYRKKYEEQVQADGKITIKYVLPDPVTVACFLGVAALSGIIGGASYDMVKKVIGRIIGGSKKIGRDVGQAKIHISNETDINVFVQYIQEFHDDKSSAVDEVKWEITKERIIWNLTNTLSPVLTEGNPSLEKIHEAVMKAFDEYQNIEMPLPKDFDSFWDDIDDE